MTAHSIFRIVGVVAKCATAVKLLIMQLLSRCPLCECVCCIRTDIERVFRGMCGRRVVHALRTQHQILLIHQVHCNMQNILSLLLLSLLLQLSLRFCKYLTDAAAFSA
jgi:hypothetical protein